MLTSQVHSACWIKQTEGHGINLPTQRKLCFILSLFNQKITYLIGSLIDKSILFTLRFVSVLVFYSL